MTAADAADATTQLTTAWETAQAGDSPDGVIDCGDTYIAYETATVEDSRFFNVWVSHDDGDVTGDPPQSVKNAVEVALDVLPTPDFRPESGELYAVVTLQS